MANGLVNIHRRRPHMNRAILFSASPKPPAQSGAAQTVRASWPTSRRFLPLLLLMAVPSACLGQEPGSSDRQESLTLRHGDRICLVGNTLAERMQHDGWLETFLQALFADKHLVFRDLGYSADQLTIRLRSEGFGTTDDWLRRCRASSVWLCFGANEAYAGAAGAETFRRQLREYLQYLTSTSFDGHKPPSVVLISPIAHEDLDRPHLPPGNSSNAHREHYTRIMREEAHRGRVAFVDLFHFTQAAYLQDDRPWTINGIHLNAHGNRRVAQEMIRQLFGVSVVSDSPQQLRRVRNAVQEKNACWWRCYRATDGYSTFGARADLAFTDGQTNREVMQRELEILERMTSHRDRMIWSVAQGGELPPVDHVLPAELPVKTNLMGPLPGGEHEFLSGEAAIQKMRVHPGMQVQLFASEEQFPELVNPVQMTFDPQGRMWVAVWPSYPHARPKEPYTDKLLIFSDDDQDGRADRVQVFADKLHNPTGFELWGGGVLVAQVPDLWFLQDLDGDGRADRRQRILHGLDSADTHHSANSFTLGPDGALYFQEGVFHQTQVETPWGPPIMNSDAAVYRFEPRTFRFHVYVPYAFANPHGHVFDAWGQDFITDATGNVNYYATPFSGFLPYPKKHTEYFGFYTQRMRPCAATEILSSAHFPAEFQGNYLNANVIGFQGISRYRLADDGSGFLGVEAEPIVSSSDPNFRPVDLEIGPDGALYFLDWQNPLIGHMQHHLRDPNRDRRHGRIYRITYAGRPLQSPANIAGAPIDALLELLKRPEDRVRYRVRMELSARPSEQVARHTRRWIAGLDPRDPSYEHHLLEALWVFQQHHVLEQAHLQRMLQSPEPRARAAATRVLCDWRDQLEDPLTLLERMVHDSHPRVRLEAVRACSFFSDYQAVQIALSCLKAPRDKFLDYCLHETIRALEPVWKPQLARQSLDRISRNRYREELQYLLDRLTVAELLELPESIVVFQELIARDEVPAERRIQAIRGLARLQGSTVGATLLQLLLDADQQGGSAHATTIAGLTHAYSMLEPGSLALGAAEVDALQQLCKRGRLPANRQLAWAWRIDTHQEAEPCWQEALDSVEMLSDLVRAFSLVRDARRRPQMVELLLSLLQDGSEKQPLSADTGFQPKGRFVRIELPGASRTLTLAEVEVYHQGRNIARAGRASQSGTAWGGEAQRAVDGNVSGRYSDQGQTHTPEGASDPWWELDLGEDFLLEKIVVWNRFEDNRELSRRLSGWTLRIQDRERRTVVEQTQLPPPWPSATFDWGGQADILLQRTIIEALGQVGTQDPRVFQELSRRLNVETLRPTTIQALSRMERSTWDLSQLSAMVRELLEYCAALPMEERASTTAADAIALARSLATALPPRRRDAVLRQIQQLGVEVHVLRTVPHLMLFDRRELFVVVGRPCQVVFENNDFMPHNLLIIQPGSLFTVMRAADALSRGGSGYTGDFVPRISEVIQATGLLQPGQAERLLVPGNLEPGEYPYVCTFPGHAPRMVGTLHVVTALTEDHALAMAPRTVDCQPVRNFVREWTADDLAAAVDELDGSPADVTRGARLFEELSCAKCHVAEGSAPALGPELQTIRQKVHRGELKRVDLIREMVHPSVNVAEAYRLASVLTVRGQIVSGLLTQRSDQGVTLALNPLERHETIDIPGVEIEEFHLLETSFMPQGLLNTASAEEVRDLLEFLECHPEIRTNAQIKSEERDNARDGGRDKSRTDK